MYISHKHFAHCLDSLPILFHLIISLTSPRTPGYSASIVIKLDSIYLQTFQQSSLANEK